MEFMFRSAHAESPVVSPKCTKCGPHCHERWYMTICQCQSHPENTGLSQLFEDGSKDIQDGCCDCV